MAISDEIKALDSPTSVNSFLRKNRLNTLSDAEIEQLVFQLAPINSKYNLDGQFELVVHNFKSRGDRLKIWLPVVISFVSLVVSIVALFKN